jgi:transglutaminase-like putative cysteine protease
MLMNRTPRPAPPQATLTIPSGAAGVRATLKIMRDLVRQGKKSPKIRQQALALTQHLKQKDKVGEVHALFEFVRDHIRYVRDVHEVETLHTAERVLEQRAGDCDDKAVLLASLLESIGYPTRFLAMGRKPGYFEHVIVETRPFGNWIALETTNAVPLGYMPPHHKRARMIRHNR